LVAFIRDPLWLVTPMYFVFIVCIISLFLVSLHLAAGFAGLHSRLGWFGFSLSNPASGSTLPPRLKGQARAAAL